MTIDELLKKYREDAENTVGKGKSFEVLMKNFLLTYPPYLGRLEKVWLWKDFPYRADFSDRDLGIDLAGKTFDGEYWAVQCKFYADENSVNSEDVSKFIALSGQEPGTIKFSKRIFILTSKFNINAEIMSKNQNPPIIQLDMEILRKAEVDWEKLDAGIFGKDAVKKRDLRDYQQTALIKAREHFQKNERGKLIMACGTGKTFTSLKIAEDLTGGRGFILFLVPSLSLMGQTLNEWASYAENPFNTLLVCSDEKVTTRAKDEDTIQRVNLPILPVDEDAEKDASLKIKNTDTAEEKARKKAAILERAAKKIATVVQNFSNDRMTVIFSTYQSIEKIIAAQKIFKTPFDLVICDEAHRTATHGDKDKAFALVHNNEKINAARRLYMTATPKLFSSESKKNAKAKDKDLEIWSMDDEEFFGGEFYRIGFRKAIEKGCLSPYKVLVLTIYEQSLPPALKKLILEKGSAISTNDALKISGCINALSKHTRKFSDKLKDDDPGFMHKAVAFCQNIKASQHYATKYEQIQEKYFEDMTPEQRKNFVQIEITHIDGTNFDSKDREEILHRLKTNSDENLCRIVSNVRCLSEGVDVPSLDAVIFLSPKKSQIEIVQAVGRALRVAKNKNFGYIIIPVIIPMNQDPDTALATSEFKEIWQVLNAIRSHDDKFDIYVQQIKMSLESETPQPPPEDNPVIIDAPGEGIQLTLDFDFEEWTYKIYARMVDSVGDRHYWLHWAKKISEIVKSHTSYIKEIIAQKDSPQSRAFNKFLEDLHQIINPSITADEAVDMLAQHLITRPVFEALFDNFSFVQNNPVSKSMTGILYQLDKTGLENDRAQLQEFYDDVKAQCSNMGDAKQRQDIIRRLYDSFFKIALDKTVEKLGIVYTPVEVVDFILQSVSDVLQKEFHRTISGENVHILDPFSGTGTFITRLIESGLIQPEDLLRKYQRELHANEIVLLAYYISAINIENAFHQFFLPKNYSPLDKPKFPVKPQPRRRHWTSSPVFVPPDFSPRFQTFSGICLTDTFQTYENQLAEIDAKNNRQGTLNDVEFKTQLKQNAALIKRQLDTKIEIIVGNPPYSVGQKSANDNAQNIHYSKLEKRIAETYAAGTDATNKNSLYDSYIKAFRWAADRISGGGIIGFVTNAGWLDGAAMDGLRNCFAQEFTSIYVFNLRGAIRGKIGDSAKREGQNIFDIMTGVAITILVKNPEVLRDKAEIFYCEVEDYLSRDDKLKKIKAVKTVLSDDFKILTPNDKGDWINQRGNIFENFIPIQPATKFDAAAKSFFITHSRGLATARDVWIYNFSKSELAKNIQTTIDFYNTHTPEDNDSTKINWVRSTVQSFNRREKFNFEDVKFLEGTYRPFCKQNIGYYSPLIDMTYQMPKFFQTGKEENLLICIPGIGIAKNFSVFITDKITDVQFQQNGQCFPLYWYEAADAAGQSEEGKGKRATQGNLFEKTNPYSPATTPLTVRRDGVTDYILEEARRKYGVGVTKKIIFYYVYGFLHLPAYREKFAADLKKSLPRLFLVESRADFLALSQAGRALAEIHLNYEKQEAAAVEVTGAEKGNFAVEKLRLSADKTTLIYNKDITIKNIPARAFEYVVNGRSPLEWIIDRYQVKTDKASKITNNPNDWCAEHNQPRYILDLILSCITVSLKTLDIVENLPSVDFRF